MGIAKDLETEMKSTGWMLKEAFKHSAQEFPALFSMSLKMYFSPVVGLFTGHPIRHIRSVQDQDMALRLASLQRLEARLAKNPYVTPEVK